MTATLPIDIHTHHTPTPPATAIVCHTPADVPPYCPARQATPPTWLSVGIHPWDVGPAQKAGPLPRLLALLAGALARPDVVAIGEAGLDKLDRDLLLTIMEQYKGGPVGLDTLAASIGEERVTLEDVCEPYLLQEGFLARTPRGRVATEKAYNHFGLPMPKRMQEQNQQETLFINEEGEETTINEDK